jgi:hypothetical protein
MTGVLPEREAGRRAWHRTYQLNAAALKGFIARLRNAGPTGPVGIYSTSAQCKDITELTAPTAGCTTGGRSRGHAHGGAVQLLSGGFIGVVATSRSTGPVPSTPTGAALPRADPWRAELDH